MPEQYIITGTINLANKDDRAGLKIQTFDRDLPSLEQRTGTAPQLLGEAISDGEGRFQINYTPEQFQHGDGNAFLRRSNGKKADLSFRVFDTNALEQHIQSIEALGRTFLSDQIIFNVPASLEVNIFMDAPPQRGITEFELLVAFIAPVVQDIPLTELTDEDLFFMTNELGLEQQREAQQRIEWLRRSAILAQDTGIPAEAFYGWGRMNLPADLEELAKVPLKDLPKVLEKLSGLKEDMLRDALLAAIEERIIPDSFRIRVDEIVRQLIRRNQILHEVIAQLQDADTKAVLAGYTVTVFDPGAAGENRGLDITNSEGKYSFTFYTAAAILPNVPAREFRLEVFSPEGEKLPEDGLVSVDMNKPETEIVPAFVKVPKPAIIKQQEQLKSVLLDLPAELQTFISDTQNIQTLSDIRRKGGLGHLDGLPAVLDPAHIRQLESLADLDRISTDIAVSKTLQNRNFDSVIAISDVPHSEFVGQLTTGDAAISESDAVRLHVMATAQTHLLNNTWMEKAAKNANGFRIQAADGVAEDAEQTCGCSDCEAAVSPGAYLTALLDYTLKHIRNNKNKIDLKFLVDTFHQPFIDLPTDCEAEEQELRQARICIEALRSYIGNRPLADAVKEAALAKAEKDYSFAAYTILLNRIGTSFEEIRRIRAEHPENRKALAERLGIDLTEPNGDELDMLFLDPGANPPNDHLLTEQAIEKLFGLEDTNRDPLSEGAKLGDDQAQITRWNLNGVVFGQNTDVGGRVYLSLTNPAPAVFNVELHQDLLRTKLVASGKIATATGTVKLVQASNSGLSGVVDIAYTADSNTISFAAIPAFLSWQLKHLRTLWSRQHHPEDAYDNDAALRLPIIDPDLIGPDDFRNPFPKSNVADPDKAFDLWLKRRAFTDTQLSGLKADRETKGLTALLKQVIGDPLPDMDALLLTLTKSGTTGDEINVAKDSITAVHFSVESFTRLMAIRAKDQLAQSDARNEKVSEQEWGELYSILVQSLKTAQFDAWRTAEQAAGIELGPQAFWFSVTEPKEGDWPPVPVAEQPLIDPAIVKQTDLPDWLAGKEAISTWNLRKTRIDQIPKELKAARDSKGFESMLRLALGHPTPGQPLQHDLNTLKKNLDSTDNTVRDNAIKQIVTDLYLTVENFNRLVAIKAADDQGDAAKKPTAAAWNELFTMLTPARKRKHEYPQWVTEEATAGLVYWKALKAKLPRWRAKAESRQTWQQALYVRSQSPVIDPTVMGADDLQHVIPGDSAFDVWKNRNDLITTLQEDLKIAREGENPDALAGLDLILKDALGFEPADLEALDKDRQTGQSIGKRLEQLNLLVSAFNYLIRIRGLAKAGQLITDPEWEIVYVTLAQVKFQRAFASMRAEERHLHITLSPDFFKIPATLLTPLPFLDASTPSWLSTWQARRDWQDILQSRIDSELSMSAGLATAIGAVEEVALPVLRDALIEASDAVGGNFSEKAEWITARLLIDAKSGGCRTTTRVAQALETLQTLIFDLRSGQFKQLAPSPLSLVSDYFDEEWKWIGSYATWRSAMFVYIYPENILHPGLLKEKTIALKELINNTRGFRFSPENACVESQKYADYFRDVCTLEIQASAQAMTVMSKGKNCHYQPTKKQSLFYMFGRAPSGKIYWSYNEVGGNFADGKQSFWEKIPGFDNTNVIRIIGAMPFRKKVFHHGVDEGKGGRKANYIVITSYIHLFCITGNADKQALKLTRLNLDVMGQWAESTTPIDITPKAPINVQSFEIVPVQTQNEFLPPGLVFHKYNENQLYYRTLDAEGTNWQPGDQDWSSFLNKFNIEYDPKTGKGNPDAGWRSIKAALNVKQDMWLVVTDRFDRINIGGPWILPGNGKNVTAPGKNISTGEKEFLGVLAGPEDSLEKYYSDTYFFWINSGKPMYGHMTSGFSGEPNRPMKQALADLISITPHSGNGSGGPDMLVYKRKKNAGAYYMYRYTRSKDILVDSGTVRAVPRVLAPLNIQLSATNLQDRRQQIMDAFALNDDATATILTYLKEAYYFVPMQLALALQSAGQYLAALDCFRTVYDYEAETGSPNKRNIYYGLVTDAKLPEAIFYQQATDWLLDPLNPHSIASTRRFIYTRFTLMSIIRCLLDFADAEFTEETSESVAQARTLYLTALDMLKLPELQQKLGICDDLIAELKIEPGKDIPPEVPAAVEAIMDALTQAAREANLTKYTGDVTKEVMTALKGNAAWPVKLTEARAVIRAAVAVAPLPVTTGALVASKSADLKEQYAVQLKEPRLDNSVQLAGKKVTDKVVDHAALIDLIAPPAKIPPVPPPAIAPALVTPSIEFCIPPNPILKALRLHAEINLYKLRTCRNIAGMKRQLEPYAAPTDTITGLPSIGAGGQLVLPGLATLQPSLYRYPVLIERAKQLVQFAGQIEAQLLMVIERRDEGTQRLLETRQQLGLAQATVRLHDLRLVQANDGVKLADLQQERAVIQINTYQAWINMGTNEYEKEMILAYATAAMAQKTASEASQHIQTKQAVISAAQLAASVAAAGGFVAGMAGVGTFLIDENFISTLGEETRKAIDATAAAQVASLNAALERRKDEWTLQKQLAEQDSLIGEQQKTIADDQVQIVTQERTIAGIGADNAKDSIEFLTNKFTNVELYDWMGNILERVYRFFLQQATAMAKLAENQLAFQRQEVPPVMIMSDYWNVLSENNFPGNAGGQSPDRRGLTGSARLLQDIYQLDQYAFNTDKRKLQLTKTISLARLAPVEFERFRETGVMTFATPMELFDRGFPGHYLRLIKRVRTSIIALVPPIDGIHAMLSTTGPSRVVIGGDIFQTVTIRRGPEFIAMSAPNNSTGVLELEPQPDMLLPFEGSGLEMNWEFNMPRAANAFDYSTLADVLITFEYTALYNADYRQQVIQSLKPAVSADRPFSFRNQFADQWYDLHNPAQTATSMTVRFTTVREDFPVHINALKIQHVLLYFIRTDGTSFEVAVNHLRYTAQEDAGTVGGSATSIDGIIGTRRGNAGSWTAMIGKSPMGEWELALPDTEEMRNRFGDGNNNGDIIDILFVITYAGRTPAWPV